MDLNLVREIVYMMENSKLSSMEIEFKDLRIKMEKNIGEREETIVVNNIPTESKKHESPVSKETEVGTDLTPEMEEVDGSEYTIIKAPMVGTFYPAPSPDSEPFVTVGKAVKKGDVVCIIEAMKLMNEIECEGNGTVAEILVNEGDMVEYGQPLFKIKL
ncbi:MAG: acetyl-CoA carboxylase biotin carboxyl carrier protein [Clostridia bacterium]|jgi:acetyl-CoA carboxylase biotin carboxyl carrier protein|nr:acetyl-CoA carboxylase biotin carboxyl carrier protein [Clostridia bacterium]